MYIVTAVSTMIGTAVFTYLTGLPPCVCVQGHVLQRNVTVLSHSLRCGSGLGQFRIETSCDATDAHCGDTDIRHGYAWVLNQI